MTVIDRVSNGCLTHDQAICFSALYVDKEEDFRQLIKKCGPHKTIIEIGTYNGISAAVLSEYAEKVYTFDVNVRSEAGTVMDFLGIKNVIRLKSDPVKIAEILASENVTLCFIDGEHYFGQPRKDYEIVKSCKNILFHDYQEPFKDVREICDSLPVEGHEITRAGTFFLYEEKP